MQYKSMILLVCVVVNIACTSSKDETLGDTSTDSLGQSPVVEDGTNQDAPVKPHRRLKSFRVEYPGFLGVTPEPPAVVSGQLLSIRGIPTDFAYSTNGKVQQLLNPSTLFPDATPSLAASYFYDQDALSEIVWETMKERKIEYEIVDGKTVAENWVDENGIEHRKSYEYDSDGNLIRVVGGFLDFLVNCQSGNNDDDDSSTRNLTLSYEDDRIISIDSDAGDVSAVYGYNANNLLASRTTTYSCASGTINETFTYNDNGQLTTFELSNELEFPESLQIPNTYRTYQYNDQGQILSISRSSQQGESENVPVMTFKYDSNAELVEISTVGGNAQTPAPVYSFTYEDGTCEQQTYTDPEFAASPTHTTLHVNIFPESLRCGYFLPSLEIR